MFTILYIAEKTTDLDENYMIIGLFCWSDTYYNVADAQTYLYYHTSQSWCVVKTLNWLPHK